MPIAPNDTQALAMDLPAGYVPAKFGQPGHLDYRASQFVVALQAQEQAMNASENAAEQAEIVAQVEAQQMLPADMPLALLEPIEPQPHIGNGIIPAPIEATAPVATGEGTQPQQAVWVDPRVIAEIDAILENENNEGAEVLKLKYLTLAKSESYLNAFL